MTPWKDSASRWPYLNKARAAGLREFKQAQLRVDLKDDGSELPVTLDPTVRYEVRTGDHARIGIAGPASTGIPISRDQPKCIGPGLSAVSVACEPSRGDTDVIFIPEV